MSDLDDKLREIILAPFRKALLKEDGLAMYDDKDEPATVEEQIAQIKQAFADEGYVDAKINNTANPLYLTGQEWYDRFEEELPPVKVGQVPSGAEMYLICDKAARRAAGIDKEEV